MRVFIAGVDGYPGWALAQHLVVRGHEVAGADAYCRRDWAAEIGSQSATPIRRIMERLEAFRENHGMNLPFSRGDLVDTNSVMNLFQRFKPEAIIHFAENPYRKFALTWKAPRRS